MYNVFIFSVLFFMAQFYEPPHELFKEEEHALKRLMPGPRNWIKKDQILTLSTWGGYIRDPQSLQHVALASKYRLIVSERCFRNGEMAKEIRALHSRVDTHTFFSDGESRWINGGILGGLLQAKEKVKDRGACAGKKTIASDRNKRNSSGKKLLEKYNLKSSGTPISKKGSAASVTSPAGHIKDGADENYYRSKAPILKNGCKRSWKTL